MVLSAGQSWYQTRGSCSQSSGGIKLSLKIAIPDLDLSHHMDSISKCFNWALLSSFKKKCADWLIVSFSRWWSRHCIICSVYNSIFVSAKQSQQQVLPEHEAIHYESLEMIASRDTHAYTQIIKITQSLDLQALTSVRQTLHHTRTFQYLLIITQQIS